MFGGTEEGTRNSFLVEVNTRDAHTLLPIISKYINAGSVIYSDEWKAYKGIKDVTGKNYTHLTVNHSREFINPAQVPTPCQ